MYLSPITARSLRIRLIYGCIYVLLILGAVTMVVPFLIMLTGSVEPLATKGQNSFFPAYLLSEEEMWARYLETKYHGLPDNLRMAWSDPDANFPTAKLKPESPEEAQARELWQTFFASEKRDPKLFSLGFLRTSRRMPSYYAREFRLWLMDRYGSLDKLNEALGTRFRLVVDVAPPYLAFGGQSLPNNPLTNAYLEFSAQQPASRIFSWDAGGYYRAVFLPRTLGPDVKAYNDKYGTHYRSFSEIPFPETVPAVGAKDWFFYVSRLLRSDFVELTPAGEAERAALNIKKEEFIQAHAKPESLRVASADVLFEKWAASQGLANRHIPQQAMDYAAFHQEKNFWKRQFLCANYVYVLDQIVLHGRAILNTLTLVCLMIAGALVVNPLAAYALSRFKLRVSYHLLLFCLSTIAFPAEVTMIPVFLQLKEFHLLNTFAALVLPGLANGFAIFLLKGFFDSLPRELYEAAEIDGASEWTVFWQLTMNLSKPILAVIALEAFVGAYGSFFYALVIAPDPSMWTIMVYIYQLRQGVDSPVVYASLILSAIPTLLIFLFCQNIILRGIVVPSEK